MSRFLTRIVCGATDLKLESQDEVTSAASKLIMPIFEATATFTNEDGCPLVSPPSSAAASLNRTILTRDWGTKTSPVKAMHGREEKYVGKCSWSSETLRLPYPGGDHGRISLDKIRVALALWRDYDPLTRVHEVARISMTLRELANMDPHGEERLELLMFEEKTSKLVMAGKDARCMTDRAARVRGPSNPSGGPRRQEAGRQRRRGGGGIRQAPYDHDARLASQMNWDNTIITEVTYKAKLKEATSNLSADVVRFRPSSGDTMAKVLSKMSQTTINLKLSDVSKSHDSCKMMKFLMNNVGAESNTKSDTCVPRGCRRTGATRQVRGRHRGTKTCR